MTWYNTDWLYRRKITLNASYISGTHTNFPILYKISSQIGPKASSNAHDIVFTDSDEVTRLSHEIDTYSEGTGNIWVRIPTLTDATSKDIYIYYGNSTATDQLNIDGYKPSSTWDSSFAMVCHMNDTTDNQTVADSSIWNSPMHKSTAGTPFMTKSFFGSGQMFYPNTDFCISSQYQSNAKNIGYEVTSQVTLTAWLQGGKQTEGNGFGYLVCRGNRGNTTAKPVLIHIYGYQAESYPHNVTYNISTQSAKYLSAYDSYGMQATSGQWGFFALTYQTGVGSRLLLNNHLLLNAPTYNNGDLVSSPSPSGIIIGNRGDLSRGLSGQLDEVRYANKSRTNGWLFTEYWNISSAAGGLGGNYFYTVDSEENAPDGTTTSFNTMSGTTTSWTWGKVLLNTGTSPRSTTQNGLSWVWDTVTGDSGYYIPSGGSTGWSWCSEDA